MGERPKLPKDAKAGGPSEYAEPLTVIDRCCAASELFEGTVAVRCSVYFYELGGFDLEEVGAKNLDRLWLRGGLPNAFLAKTDADSFKWRADFVSTFVERDIPRLGVGIAAGVLARFWTMLAHYHGQVCNLSELGRSLGVSHTTIRSYIDLLSNTFVVRELRPWAENLGKRLVKTPKVYVADSGLLHSLLGLPTRRDLDAHPKLGASWEGFVIAQIARRVRASRSELYFWGTHAGAELDVLLVRGRERLGFEIKRTDAPKLTPCMRAALADLELSRLYVVHAGKTSFDLDRRVRAVAATELLTEL